MRRLSAVAFLLFATMWWVWAAEISLSGTVVDASGSAIAGAGVQVQSVNGTAVAAAQSDASGFFTISGLPAGNYRIVISHADFESKEIPIRIGTEALAPLRISLSL